MEVPWLSLADPQKLSAASSLAAALCCQEVSAGTGLSSVHVVPLVSEQQTADDTITVLNLKNQANQKPSEMFSVKGSCKKTGETLLYSRVKEPAGSSSEGRGRRVTTI